MNLNDKINGNCKPFLVVLVLFLGVVTGCKKNPPTSPKSPEAQSKQSQKVQPPAVSACDGSSGPVKLEGPGLSNFYRISDVLYRGAQPEKEGFAELEKLGIKTIVNLRSMHSDKELIEGTKLALVEIPMRATNPREEDLMKFLEVVIGPENQPVFVHCKHGADRTGMMVAAYRVIIQGWDKEKAVAEMTGDKFNFHDIFKDIPQFIRDLDVKKIRNMAGLSVTVGSEQK